MPNILRDYQDIIETYLIGLRTQLGANFRFYIDLVEGSVTFKRDVPAAPKDSALALKYIFDKETLEHEHPDAERSIRDYEYARAKEWVAKNQHRIEVPSDWY